MCSGESAPVPPLATIDDLPSSYESRPHWHWHRNGWVRFRPEWPGRNYDNLKRNGGLTMRRRSCALSALACLAAFALAVSPVPARGAGLLIADGGLGGVLEIKEHSVKVTINNGIAVTEVTQVFRNTENRHVEALYTLPVPRAASVSNFSMWIDGREMVGEVVEKKRAREIYNSYKQQRKDPGLLEQTDHKTFELRIFPIA